MSEMRSRQDDEDELAVFGRRLGLYLKERRVDLNLTQEKFSQKARIDCKHLQALESERGPRDVRISTLRKLSRASGIETYRLVLLAFNER